jgi:hypothetical protein
VIHVVTWVWGDKYPQHYVDKLKRAVTRNLSEPHEFIVAKPFDEDKHLTEIQGCFARLRNFDPAWQKSNGIEEGDTILSLDLDNLIVGNIDHLVTRLEPFVILQGVNAMNPNPFNGSVWSLKAGYRRDVWTDFSVERAKQVPFFAFPDDQAWFHHKIPDAASFTPKDDGVYGFQKPGWPEDDKKPSNSSVVCFFGKRDPSQFQHLEWVRRAWL